MSKHCPQCGKFLNWVGWCISCGNQQVTVKSELSKIFVTTPPAYLLPKQPRTQKGKGLIALKAVWPNHAISYPLFAQDPDHLEHLTSFPTFARPCPSSPKHGYIDSRVVKSVEEVRSLLKEVLADDPGGEVMLCPFIEASHNAIWTPSSLVIGPGHDGATAGRNTVTIPLVGTIPTKLKEVLSKAGVGEKEWPYVEVVSTRANVILTQLRAGPVIPSVAGDLITKETTVRRVLKADPDKFKDREWERLIESSSGEDGLVVWYPGGAATSHFAVHAFTHGIPVVFGDRPKTGEILQPTVEGGSFDPEEILKGIIVGSRLTLNHSSANPEVALLLIALHNAAAMTGPNSWWLGVGAAIMLRLGTVALRGEARHLAITGLGNNRELIYQRSIAHTLHRHRASIRTLVNVFRYGAWNGTGYGGIKWAACGVTVLDLFEAVRALAIKKDPESASGVVRALNLAVNQAHNGGWWLNKFASPALFDLIPSGNVPSISLGMGAAYKAGSTYKALTQPEVDKEITRMARWPELSLRPPQVKTVEIAFSENQKVIGLKLTTRLLRASTKRVVGLIETPPPNLKDPFFLVEGEDGYRVEARPLGEESVVVWQDKSLRTIAATLSEEFTKKD